MRVLITRPEPKSTELAAILRERGCDCVVWPALVIHPLHDHEALLEACRSMSPGDIGVFVSPNAVTHLLDAVTEEERRIIKELAIFSVGPGTAKALEAAGFEHVSRPEQGASSELLLDHPGLKEVKGRRVWLFRGQSGRELIARTLAERGAEVEYVCCYLSLPSTAPTAPLLKAWQDPFDLVITTSLAGAQSLWKRLPDEWQPQLQHCPVTSMGEKMLTWLEHKGFSAIYPLHSASNEDIAGWVSAFQEGEHETRSDKVQQGSD